MLSSSCTVVTDSLTIKERFFVQSPVSVAACSHSPVPPRGNAPVVPGAAHLLCGLRAAPAVRQPHRNVSLVPVLRLRPVNQVLQLLLADASGVREVVEDQQQAEKHLRTVRNRTRQNLLRHGPTELLYSEPHAHVTICKLAHVILIPDRFDCAVIRQSLGPVYIVQYLHVCVSQELHVKNPRQADFQRSNS